MPDGAVVIQVPAWFSLGWSELTRPCAVLSDNSSLFVCAILLLSLPLPVETKASVSDLVFSKVRHKISKVKSFRIGFDRIERRTIYHAGEKLHVLLPKGV